MKTIRNFSIIHFNYQIELRSIRRQSQNEKKKHSMFIQKKVNNSCDDCKL